MSTIRILLLLLENGGTASDCCLEGKAILPELDILVEVEGQVGGHDQNAGEDDIEACPRRSHSPLPGLQPFGDGGDLVRWDADNWAGDGGRALPVDSASGRLGKTRPDEVAAEGQQLEFDSAIN